MRISNFEAFGLAVVPGVAEKMEKDGHSVGSMGLAGYARKVAAERTGLYLGVAFIVVGLVAAFFSERQTLAKSTTAFGACLFTTAAKRLVNTVSTFQTIINSRARS